MQVISCKQLEQRLHEQAAAPLLLDVREPWEFQICNIPGSINLPMQQVVSAAAQMQVSRETVVICHHGIRSLQIAHLLKSIGFIDIYNLSGGVDAWARDVDPSMAAY